MPSAMMTDPSDLPVLGASDHLKVGTRFLFKPTHRDGANVKPMVLIALPEEPEDAARMDLGCRKCIARDPRRSPEAGTDIHCHSLPNCGNLGAFVPPTPENTAKVVAWMLEGG